MNLLSTKDITELEERLLEILAKEYNSKYVFVNVNKVEVDYMFCENIDDEPLITFYINYGDKEAERIWQKELKLYYKEGNIDFIAGQFFEALVEGEK